MCAMMLSIFFVAYDKHLFFCKYKQSASTSHSHKLINVTPWLLCSSCSFLAMIKNAHMNISLIYLKIYLVCALSVCVSAHDFC